MGSPSFFSLLFCFYIFARPHISNCRTYEIYVTCVIDPEGRPGLIGVIRSKLLPSTRIFIHIRPSILDPDPRPDRPGNYVTMVESLYSPKYVTNFCQWFSAHSVHNQFYNLFTCTGVTKSSQTLACLLCRNYGPISASTKSHLQLLLFPGPSKALLHQQGLPS